MKLLKTVITVWVSLFWITLAGCGNGGGGSASGAGIQALNLLDRPSEGDFSSAVAINDTGTVVRLSDTAKEVTQGARWTVDATGVALIQSVLDSLDGNYSAAYAVNNGGTVVGESSSGAATVPVSWPAGSITPSPLTLPSGGGTNGAAYGINTIGQIVGEAQDVAGNTVAVMWAWPGSTAVTLPGLGGSASSAYFINDAGEAVGEAEDACGVMHPVMWRIGAGTSVVAELPMLSPGTDTGGIAFGINQAGDIVGEVELADGSRKTVLWQANAAGGFEVIETRFSSAYAVKDANRVCADSFGVAFEWNPCSAAITPCDENTASPDISQAFGVNENNLVVGRVGTQAFVEAPQ
jgi:uncharacterized membrane protein